MEDSIGNGCIQPNVTKFANALDAKTIDLRVGLRNWDRFHSLDICIDRDQVFRQVIVVVTRGTTIDFSRLVECSADAPDLSAHQLTLRGLGIDDPPCSESADHPWRAYLTGAPVDANFDQMTSEGELDAVLHLRAASENASTSVEALEPIRRDIMRQVFRINLNCAIGCTADGLAQYLALAARSHKSTPHKPKNIWVAASERAVLRCNSGFCDTVANILAGLGDYIANARRRIGPTSDWSRG
jgi:hypothetical protein